ncbi:hypothetical protein D3C76_1440020 [compost metagenome]
MLVLLLSLGDALLCRIECIERLLGLGLGVLNHLGQVGHIHSRNAAAACERYRGLHEGAEHHTGYCQ